MADVETRLGTLEETVGGVKNDVAKLSNAVFGNVEDEDNVKDGLVRIVRDLRKDARGARYALYFVVAILLANTGLAQHVEIAKLLEVVKLFFGVISGKAP